MITGDNLSTACEIARQTNIVESHHQLMILNLNSNHDLFFENLECKGADPDEKPDQDENEGLLTDPFREEGPISMTGVVFAKLYD